MKLRFEGSRFDGAEIPVSALQELLRFQELIIAAAKTQWEQQNPDQEIPSNFEETLALTLKRIEEGSAVPVLEREAVDHSLDEIFGDGVDDVHLLFADVYSDSSSIDAPSFPDWADIDAFWNFGSSIESDEAIVLSATVGSTRTIKFTGESRKKIIPTLKDRLKKSDAQQHTTKSDGIIVGKVLRVDKTAKSFQILGIAPERKVNARFTDSRIGRIAAQSLADGMGGVQSYVRILGKIRLVNGIPERILKADSIEALKPTDSPRIERIAAIAALELGWVDGFYGEPISVDELNSAIIFSEELQQRDELPFAEIFPNEDGEIEFQWASSKMVLSVRRTLSGEFEYHFKKRGEPSVEDYTKQITDVEELIRKFSENQDQ